MKPQVVKEKIEKAEKAEKEEGKLHQKKISKQTTVVKVVLM